MIPLSVRMTGWMRYRDEQVADFRGGNLIAICGENGAGKSSIFDAITFALYGEHRLGSQGTGELVSQDKDRLSVEFEFEAEGQRYLVRRSRTRKAGEGDQGLWIWDEGASDWTPVPGTEKEAALNRTLANVLRMTSDAFTSSFLLRQGAATEFLDAKPKPRFDIISSLIGLKEYEALEKAARDAGRVEDAKVKDLTARLAEFEGVDAECVERLRAAVACARQREEDDTRLLLAARALLADAQRYTRLDAEVLALTVQIGDAAALVAQKEQIEQDAENLEAIAAAVDKVARIEATLADATRAEAAAEQALSQAVAIDVEALARDQAASASAVKTADKRAKSAERDHAAAAKAEREAHDFATLAAAILGGQRNMGECDERIREFDAKLATLPALQAEANGLAGIAAALPSLRAMKDARELLEKVAKGDPDAALRSLVARRKALLADVKKAESRVVAAEKDLSAAQTALAECGARVVTLADELKQRRAASGEAICSRCGQPVDKKHARLEVERAIAESRDAKRDHDEAVAVERAAETALAAARKSRDAAGEEVAEVERQTATAESRRDEYVRSKKSFVASAPAELTAKVNGSATAAALTKVIAAHGDAPKRAATATKALQQLHSLDGARSAAMAERARTAEALAADEAKLNGRLKDVPSAQAAHDAAAGKLAAASSELEGARDGAEKTRAREVQAQQALEAAGKQRDALESEAGRRTEEAAGHRRAAAAFADGLGALEPLALEDPSGTLSTLRAQQRGLAGARDRKSALDIAVRDQIAWEAQRAAKLDEIASIPEAHRVDEPSARGVLAEAEAAAAAASAAREDAHRQLATAEARLEQLGGMQAERAAAQARARLLKKLVKLLGKDGLQGLLVTNALNSITSHANAFLQRLTGGSLLLSLERQSGDALELRALDATCMREPRSVQVLSGSQKFRCAVAVASGIGQYGGAGGMRSIVIDEGFGSLDRDGQALMVDELKNLATHMDKVIVVSHLEAFADRANFPDQIAVVRDGEGSRIERS